LLLIILYDQVILALFMSGSWQGMGQVRRSINKSTMFKGLPDY
jgi:hypothetical protein